MGLKEGEAEGEAAGEVAAVVEGALEEEGAEEVAVGTGIKVTAIPLDHGTQGTVEGGLEGEATDQAVPLVVIVLRPVTIDEMGAKGLTREGDVLRHGHEIVAEEIAAHVAIIRAGADVITTNGYRWPPTVFDNRLQLNGEIAVLRIETRLSPRV